MAPFYNIQKANRIECWLKTKTTLLALTGNPTPDSLSVDPDAFHVKETSDTSLPPFAPALLNFSASHLVKSSDPGIRQLTGNTSCFLGCFLSFSGTFAVLL